MNLYDVMRTTFAARDFSDEPVDDATLYRILDNARFAPSGGNRQGWRVIVVRDRAKRAALVDLIRPTMRRYVAQVAAGENPWNTVVPTKVGEAAIAAVELPPGMIERMMHAHALIEGGDDDDLHLAGVAPPRGQQRMPHEVDGHVVATDGRILV